MRFLQRGELDLHSTATQELINIPAMQLSILRKNTVKTKSQKAAEVRKQQLLPKAEFGSSGTLGGH